MKKVVLWQFFTKNNIWLRPHIQKFIEQYIDSKEIVFDPFAGDGDLLKLWIELGFKKEKWYDIDTNLNWKMNDSLINIPKIQNSFIITNPPYLTNYSAKRKWVFSEVQKYFDECCYDDLYKLALEKILENNKYWVAIIPETFMNSTFNKSRLTSITILEENPFLDTENPVCVICFNNKKKNLDEIKMYKNDTYLWTLEYFENMRLKPTKKIDMKFNDINWEIALRAIDMTKDNKQISFMKKSDLDYNLSGIKQSSRLITIININIKNYNLDELIRTANNYLKNYREETQDILFSPFKWNTKSGSRRRRIDYKSARAILEESILNCKTI